MQVSIKGLTKLVATTTIIVMLGANSYITYKQQDTLDTLLGIAINATRTDMQHQSMLWDLHRRVGKLEHEDQRIMAHVRWFVMRRSGTDELRKMETVVAKLERAD